MSRLRILAILTLAVAAFAALAMLVLGGPAPATQNRSELLLAPVAAAAHFRSAFAPKQVEFPRDHGAHLEFQTEWWYFTGNLKSEDNRRFGYQLTIFRRGLAAGVEQRASDLAANHLYFAHFALTDEKLDQHLAFERYSRGAGGLAGADSTRLRAYLEDWTVDSTADSIELHASEGPIELRLSLMPAKPPVVQGESGLSRKSEQPGNASFYVSMTDLETQGRVSLRGESFAVSGKSWFDHEWGTSALGADAVGWDWFGLQLDDGRDLMLFQIRTRQAGVEPVSGGTVVYPDGTTRTLSLAQVDFSVLGSWRSRTSGADYPVRWRLAVPSEDLDLLVEPIVDDQENRLAIVYWEGAVTVSGTRNGVGYMELTGYGSGLPGLY